MPMSKKMAATLFLLGFLISGVLFLSLAYKSLGQLSDANYSLMSAINLRDGMKFLETPDGELKCLLVKLSISSAEELSEKNVEEPILFRILGTNLAGVTNSEIEEALKKAKTFDFETYTSKCN